ncbi:hypothetical protein CVU82_02820 [Candidatus Falkowbacteria bacterium HGW-Falkowbacteria-1]|jgi:glycosyltransferase involved in cell wall biosynthesis|uniref:Glycosyltransferase family 1 protein n=1 Tax=Candidatus Falkowbacteria bacterium HGW-Falkowbacteria-1 TaxID=2013768 RepID=A0A2N2E9S3_9BACT|nr:MAG: hypothetical protein CVU82_02820 [Candidatus Falkowbacteria bacterium HGW-Falkowbacteria-1]
MKIGVDTRVLMDKQYSGVSIFTFNLLSSLLKLDKLNTYSFFYNSFKKVEKNDLFNKNAVQTFYPNKIFNYLMQKTLSWPKIDNLLGSPDVFYMPHINFASLSNKTKKVITVHDLSFLRYPEFFSRRKNFWHKALNIKKNLKKFDRIVAVSQNTKNDLVELMKIEEDKISVVYPGISDDLSNDTLNESVDYLFQKYGIDRDYVLYLGTIEPRKNISGLMRAYNHLRDSGIDVLLVLVGSWGWKTDDIRKEWGKSKYKQDIKFIGYLIEEEKSIFYKNAKLFVYPSFYEGFGFPPLEAMHFGVPVISSNSSSLPEVLSNAALLVNSDKELELADAMMISLTDKLLRNKLIERGRERVKIFSWQNTAEEYLKIFNNL